MAGSFSISPAIRWARRRLTSNAGKPTEKPRADALLLPSACRKIAPLTCTLSSILPASGRMKLRVMRQQTAERALDIGDKLGLAWRASLRFVPGLERPLVTRLNKNALHHYPR